jgi:hypothetical protein
MIPDGTRLYHAQTGKQYVAHCPRWYRVDRWLFWAWVLVSKRPRAEITISAIEVESRSLGNIEVKVPRIVNRPVRAYEDVDG